MKILTLIGCLFFIQLHAQKSVNLIISIDQDIPPGIQRPKIRVQHSDSSAKVFPVDYYPGRLIVPDTILTLIDTSNIKEMKLLFDFTEFSHNSRKDYHYEIQISPKLFDNYFNIIKIYNTSKRKYRKLKPVAGTQYTYIFQDPSGWRTPL